MTATGTAVAKREPTNFEISLAEYEPQIAAVLPAHIPPDRFRRIVITAVNQNPSLLDADRRSLFTSCIKAATDGLYPDGRESALVIFNTKVKRNGREEWVDMVQYLPMVFGIRKRMRNTGEVKSATAEVVYQNDAFDYALGDEPYINHKPALGDRGQPIAAYAIIKLTNGEIIREVMDNPAIERVRQVSRSKNGPAWTGWWSEMARKTVLRRASKSAPTSPEIDMLLRRDDDLDGGEAVPQITPPRPTRARPEMRVVEPEATVLPPDATEDADHDEDGVVIEHQDVALQVADAMPPLAPEQAELLPEIYTVPPSALENGAPDWKKMTDLFKASVSKAEAVEILNDVLADNTGKGRLLTELEALGPKGKERAGALVTLVNARKQELMAQSPEKHQ